MHRRLILAAALVPSLLFAQPPSRQPATPFCKVAAQNFESWDANRDGTLSPTEIDRLVVDQSIKGEPAAALAAMKLVVRSTKIKVPDLTRDFVENHANEPAGELLPSEQPAASTDGKPAPTARPPSSLQRRYESALRKIRGAKSDIFADGTPDIDRCRQGPLGDCFLIAAIGAATYRDAESIKKMITTSQGRDGTMYYTVAFPNGKEIRVDALTDAQYAMTSSTGGDGAWLAILEKAYGTLRNASRPESRQSHEATDAIATGGSLSSTLAAFTGRSIERITLRSSAGTDLEGVAKRGRKSLAAAVTDRRLAGANTGKEKLPPGINGHHAYAILGFDAENDTVKLWNPHGNSFRPKGGAEPGMETGYPTRAGIFEVPVKDFVRIFNSMNVESERPNQPARRG